MSGSQRLPGHVFKQRQTEVMLPLHGVLDTVGFGRLIERHHDAKALGTILRLLEVRCLPQCCDGSHGPLGSVVVRRGQRLAQECFKALSPIHVVAHRLCDC